VAGRRVAHNSAAMVPAGCGELAGRALLAGDHASGGHGRWWRGGAARWSGGVVEKKVRRGAAQWRWRGEVGRVGSASVVERGRRGEEGVARGGR